MFYECVILALNSNTLVLQFEQISIKRLSKVEWNQNIGVRSVKAQQSKEHINENYFW